MEKSIGQVAPIISAAAQSYLGILALLSIALSVLAYVFFSKASEKVKAGIFLLLFFGVIGFGMAMFRVPPPSSQPATVALEPTKSPVEIPQGQRWYVVVKSVYTVDEAKEAVARAKRMGFGDAEYILKEGSRAIAVFVGKDLSYAEALHLKHKAINSGLSEARDAYLWPYER